MNYSVGDKEVSIALCTFNGVLYLKEQLDSIVNQKYVPFELVIGDDDSTDSTVYVINNFTKATSIPIRFYRNKCRIGSALNYSKAINLCKTDYVALCDQDDIWKPEKLEMLMQAMKKAESKYGCDLPLLVHSDLTVIDEKGKVIANSFMKLRKIRHYKNDPLKRLLAQNFVTGNTVLINRSLIEAALPIPEEAIMHDWWLALVAAAAGNIDFINHSTVLYRQHSTNVIGANDYYSVKNLTRIIDLQTMEKELGDIIRQAEALSEHLEKRTELEVPTWLKGYLIAVKRGGKEAVATVNRYGIRKQGLIRNAIYIMMLLKSGYRKYL